MKIMLALTGILAAPVAAAGFEEAPLDVRTTAEATFTKPPAALIQGEAVKIAFEASAATDGTSTVQKEIRRSPTSGTSKSMEPPSRRQATPAANSSP